MKFHFPLALLLLTGMAHAQTITTSGQPAQLNIRSAGAHSIRITLKPLSYKEAAPYTPALAIRKEAAPEISIKELHGPLKKRVGNLLVNIRPKPLTLLLPIIKAKKYRS